nr:putative F-box protein At1g19160 [Ipomoea batatas]
MIFLLLGTLASSNLQDENDVNRGRRFQLALLWPSGYYKTLPPNKMCLPNKVVNMFTIHGLWPHDSSWNSPQLPPGGRRSFEQAKIDPQLRNQLRRYWPDLEQRIDELFWARQPWSLLRITLRSGWLPPPLTDPTRPFLYYFIVLSVVFIVSNSRDDMSHSDRVDIISPEIIFDVLILNPFTREIKALPSIKIPDKPPYRQRIQFGFGLSNNMSWKIIMLLSFQDANMEIKDNLGIVMVCSRVGNFWSWRQIDAALYSSYLHYPMSTGDFYFKGKYYWPKIGEYLVWFDLDDEVFGKIEPPCNGKDLLHFTVMNESIAVITGIKPCTVNELCIEIWLMDENDNNINWHKHASIPRSGDIWRTEHFNTIGFWNPSGHLLVFSGLFDLMYTNFYDNQYYDEEFVFKRGIGPNLISIDLETYEKKTIFASQEKKSTLSICLNQDGHVQVCSDRSVDSNILWNMGAYARTCNESLKLL